VDGPALVCDREVCAAAQQPSRSLARLTRSKVFEHSRQRYSVVVRLRSTFTMRSERQSWERTSTLALSIGEPPNDGSRADQRKQMTASAARRRCLLTRWSSVLQCRQLFERFSPGGQEPRSTLFPETEGFMSTEVPIRPACSACGSTKVGTLAKEITKDTLWRCALCGETFKAPQVSASETSRTTTLR